MKRLIAKLISSAALTAGIALAPLAGAHALTVSPPYFDFSAASGDAVLDVIRLYNEGSEPITVYPSVADFTANDAEDGTPRLFQPTDGGDSTGLARWISVSSEPVTIEPGQRGNVEFSINVPRDNAQPGGHYGAIVLSEAPPAGGGDISIASQIGALILLRVDGEISEMASVAEFGFAKKALWYEHLPVDFFLRFENYGNTHLRPSGTLVIENWYGSKVAKIPVNDDMGGVLPRSIRKFDFGWRKSVSDGTEPGIVREWKNFAIGKYTATLVVSYGLENKLLSETRTFLVWPWRLMTAFGIALVLLLISLAYGIRVYNKSIIRRYENAKVKS